MAAAAPRRNAYQCPVETFWAQNVCFSAKSKTDGFSQAAAWHRMGLIILGWYEAKVPLTFFSGSSLSWDMIGLGLTWEMYSLTWGPGLIKTHCHAPGIETGRKRLCWHGADHGATEILIRGSRSPLVASEQKHLAKVTWWIVSVEMFCGVVDGELDVWCFHRENS